MEVHVLLWDQVTHARAQAATQEPHVKRVNILIALNLTSNLFHNYLLN